MINSVISNSPYIVTNYSTGYNYINNYSGAQGIGNMRFNTTTQNIEIWDGNTWIILQSGSATVDLSSEAKQAIEWAHKQVKLLQAAELRAKENATVQDALKTLAEAQEKLSVVMTLTEPEKSL